jgi:hypothetical protein
MYLYVITNRSLITRDNNTCTNILFIVTIINLILKKKIVRVYEYIVEGSHDIIFLIGPFQDDQIFKCV